MSEKILVSACLAGYPCRYDGKAQTDSSIVELLRSGIAVPVCPECMGGLPTPRLPAEIVGGSGEDVLFGTAKVVASDKCDHVTDVTASFIKGAEAALAAAKENLASKAILKANSPSCGCGTIYDGTFSGTRKHGNGVTAAMLLANGISVESI